MHTSDSSFWPNQGDEIVLHEFAAERVVMRRLRPAQQLQIGVKEGGAELFVFQGELELDGKRLPANVWFRLPPGDSASLTARDDSLVLLKTVHLAAS